MNPPRLMWEHRCLTHKVKHVSVRYVRRPSRTQRLSVIAQRVATDLLRRRLARVPALDRIVRRVTSQSTDGVWQTGQSFPHGRTSRRESARRSPRGAERRWARRPVLQVVPRCQRLEKPQHLGVPGCLEPPSRLHRAPQASHSALSKGKSVQTRRGPAAVSEDETGTTPLGFGPGRRQE